MVPSHRLWTGKVAKIRSDSAPFRHHVSWRRKSGVGVSKSDKLCLRCPYHLPSSKRNICIELACLAFLLPAALHGGTTTKISSAAQSEWRATQALLPGNGKITYCQGTFQAGQGTGTSSAWQNALRSLKHGLATEMSVTRSILGVSAGGLSPVHGGLTSCSTSGGGAFDPQGHFALTTDSARNVVCSDRIDPQTGALTPVSGSPFPTGGASSDHLAFDPSGQFVFVSNPESNNITVFSFDRETGALSPVPGSPFAAGSEPLDLTTDAFGRYLYVANNLSNNLSAYSINRSTGALTPVSGSPFKMGSFLYRVAADPLGRFLFAMDSNNIFSLSIGTGGSLSAVPGSPLTLFPGPSAIATDPTGQFMFVTQRYNSLTQPDTVASYRIAGNGSLSEIGTPRGIAPLVSPSAIGVSPGGLWFYVVNLLDNSSYGYSWDEDTGELDPIPGSPFLTCEDPLDVDVFSELDQEEEVYGGTFFSDHVAVVGGTPPYSFSITAGALPAGLTLNAATGIVSGTPTGPSALRLPPNVRLAAISTSTFTIKVADSGGQSASQEFKIEVYPGPPPGPTATLPSSARAQGLNGAFYTTDVTASNLGNSSANLTFKFLGNNKDGTTGEEKTYALAAGTTRTFSDILGSVFGKTTDYGGISISSPSFDVAVLSQTSTPGFGGTFGQSVPVATSTALIQNGTPQSIVGVREDGAFRTNLILCNAISSALDVDVNLVAGNGSTLGTKRYTLAPLGMTQVTKVVRDLGVAGDVKGARLVLSTPINGGAFSAYASAIDNVTNDPRTLLPRASQIPYVAPSRWYLPSSARAGGAGGAFFTTDLTIANVGSKKADGFIKFLGNNKDGTGGVSKPLSIPAGQSVTYTDVLKSLFGLDSDFGAIEIGAGSIFDLVIVGQTSTPGFGGTFGQSVPAMANEDLVRYQSPKSIVGVREDASFRTNLILCNTVEFQSVDLDVALVGPDGTTIGTKRYTLRPLEMTQVGRVALALGGSANLNGARLDLSVATQGGSVAAYASAIDNVTNDPRTLLPQ